MSNFSFMLLSSFIFFKKEVMFLSSLKNKIELELSTKTDKTGFNVSNSVVLIVGFISSNINKKRLEVFKKNNKKLFLPLYFSL
jgi:hypothetical protein